MLNILGLHSLFRSNVASLEVSTLQLVYLFPVLLSQILSCRPNSDIFYIYLPLKFETFIWPVPLRIKIRLILRVLWTSYHPQGRNAYKEDIFCHTTLNINTYLWFKMNTFRSIIYKMALFIWFLVFQSWKT